MSLRSYKNSTTQLYNIISISMPRKSAPYYHRKLAKMGKSPRKYRKYSREKRLELIRKVIQEGEPVSLTARRLGIANTSARLIIHTYLIGGGHVFQKKADIEKRRIRERREAERQRFQMKKVEAQAKRREKRQKKAQTIKMEDDQEEVIIRPLFSESEPTVSYEPQMIAPVQVLQVFWVVPLFPPIIWDDYPLLSLENSPPDE